MALRYASRRVCACAASRLATTSTPAVLQTRQYASAIPVPTTTASDTFSANPQRESHLSHPDPQSDSQTATFTSTHDPFHIATYSKPPPVMVKGEGCRIWDMENRSYLDLTAGIAVNSLGHSHPDFITIITQQAAQLTHCSNLYHNAWSGELAKELVHQTKASGGMHNAARVFLSNSGTEANEAALKFARKVGKIRDPSGEKFEIVSFTGSFHGRTMGALSATANPKYQAPFAPMIPGFRTGTFNDIAALDSLISDKTCGVIVEPIQGEGGVYPADLDFLAALRQKTKDVGAVLIYDEIQCGMGRTGKFWAHSSFDKKLHPDIITTAKALGNGYPIGAVIASDEVAEAIVIGDHGTTFGGSPLASRIGHWCVQKLSDPELLSTVEGKSALFREHFAKLRARFPDVVAEDRGKGLILGLQLTQDPVPLITAARERGLLVITAGKNTLRFVPPLIITEQEIEEAMTILGQAMESVFAKGQSVHGEEVGGQQEHPPVQAVR